MNAAAGHIYPYTAGAFGCRWASDFPLLSYQSLPAGADADIFVNRRLDVAPPRGNAASSPRIREDEQGIRCVVDNIATLDTFGLDRIDVRTETGWSGSLPPAFYGAITASLLARRGGIPMHASAVALNGKAVLLCGDSGAGKSTLTAALIGSGAKLISDDLSVLESRHAETAFVLLPGRCTLRLFPIVAKFLKASVELEAPLTLAGEKVVASPPTISYFTETPLAAVILLNAEAPSSSKERTAGIERYIYHASGVRRIPGHRARVSHLRSLAERIPVYNMPRIETRSFADFRAVAGQFLETISPATVSCL